MAFESNDLTICQFDTVLQLKENELLELKIVLDANKCETHLLQIELDSKKAETCLIIQNIQEFAFDQNVRISENRF